MSPPGLSGYPSRPTPAMQEFEAAVGSGDADRMLASALAVWAPLRTSAEVDARIRGLIVDALSGLRTLGRFWVDHPPAYGRLAGITASTLAVAADVDEPDFIRIAELLARDIPTADLVVLPGVDHNIPVRAAAELTRVLQQFLTRIQETP